MWADTSDQSLDWWKESEMAEQRRRWSPEFKRDAVNLVRSSGRPVAEIARELGVGESSLAYWLEKDRKTRLAEEPERFAADAAESEEIRRLRKRVIELETEREILKRAAVFWMKESNG
jgi:transposase